MYGDLFGAPEFIAESEGGNIARVTVVRGAPCGATWGAVEGIIGMPEDEGIVRIGLETQFFCKADPSDWDPIYGKSPVHFAGHIHEAALKKALKKQ